LQGFIMNISFRQSCRNVCWTLAGAAALIAVGALLVPRVWAARGGAPHASGGAGTSFHAGGGGGAHYSVGHAPTFSAPRVSRAPEYHAPAIRSTPHYSRPEFKAPAVTRPNVSRPNFENRPEFARRPAIEGRPDVVGRPGFENHAQNRYDFFGRPGVAEHPGLAVRPSYVNHPEYRANVVRPGVGRPGGGTLARDSLHGSWYHGDWHRNWKNGRYGWYGRPAWWWGSNWWGAGYLPGYAAWQIPWNWGYWSYYNPYYTAPLTFGSTTVNYSEPIVLATPPAGVDQSTAQDQANGFFDAARDAFMHGDYQMALDQVDKAIALLPNDSVLHEFRGLALFAMGDYRQAAASLYAAMSVGPGWDWTTMSGFYPDTDVYTQQLRALEQYVGTHPTEPDARFVLAYQYLTCGYVDQAIPQLQTVVQINPKDQLSAQLLASLTNPQTATPETASDTGAAPPDSVPINAIPPSPTSIAPPGTPSESPSAPPVNAADLAGRWTATRPDGGTIVLNLGSDSKYDWAYSANGESKNFAGAYSVADNLLILKQGDTPTMVGQVTMVNNRQFSFKMPGGNPNDPGLTFTRS
jgi:tetratricopeptide (TPR) repeat protein